MFRMKIQFSKLILASFLIFYANPIYSSDISGSENTGNKFYKKIQSAYTSSINNLKNKNSNTNTSSATYPAAVQQNDSTLSSSQPASQTKSGFSGKIKSFYSNIQPKSKQSGAVNTTDEEGVVNIIPSVNEKTDLKEKIKNVFNKKQKQERTGKLYFQKGSLTEINETKNIKSIKEHISNEEYFKHDAKNKIYLDRFKTYGASEEKSAFYEGKNIEENENGDIQVNLGNGIVVDKLLEKIEQTTPEEADANPIELSLKDSIAIAIAKHPDVLSAKLNTEIYKSRIIQEWAAYFPSFSAGVNWDYNYTKYHGYHYGSGYNSVYVPTLSAGMLVFDFGKTKAGVDIAQTDYDASRYDLQDSINLIIYSIKSAYYNVLFAQKQIEVYNKTIEDFDLQLASAQKYFSIGKKPLIDVLTAEYNAGNAKLNLVKANNTLENAKVTFANTLGLPEFANFELSDGLPCYEYEIDLEDLLQDAFNIRPDLLSCEKELEASYLEVRRAKRYFTPDLTANGGMSYSDIDNSNSSSYRVGLDLSYNNFNFLQLKKQYDITVQQYKKALADYESKRQTVYLEVKQAFIDYNTSKQGVKQAILNVDQAKAQHYHATGRYKAGYGDALEIKDAENTYLNAQLAYYQALLDYNLSLAQLEKVVGRPIDKSGNKTLKANEEAEDNSSVEKSEETSEEL